MSLFWRGQDYLIGNMECVKLVDLPSPLGYFCKVLASTEKKKKRKEFSCSHRCRESIYGKRCGHIRNVEMDAKTLRLYRLGWNT